MSVKDQHTLPLKCDGIGLQSYGCVVSQERLGKDQLGAKEAILYFKRTTPSLYKKVVDDWLPCHPQSAGPL